MIKANEGDVAGITVADPTQELEKLQLKVNGRVMDVQLPAEEKAGSSVAVAL